MQGEIDVERVMRFLERQRGMGEWVALKAYWSADKAGKQEVARLYGEVLARALRKWRLSGVRRGKLRG